MFYKVSKGSATFDKLKALRAKMDLYNEQARALVIELGGQSFWRTGGFIAGGGISAIHFAGAAPAGWKQVHKNEASAAYMPKIQRGNKAILDKIDALPKVHQAEVNTIINYKPQFIAWCFFASIGVKWRPDFCLVEIAKGAQYEPLADMEEVTESAFEQLREITKPEPETI